MKKLSISEAIDVCRRTMPKEMSDWFEERVFTGQYSVVDDGNHTGVAMKSRDSTIVFFPGWSCASQFKDVVNKLR